MTTPNLDRSAVEFDRILTALLEMGIDRERAAEYTWQMQQNNNLDVFGFTSVGIKVLISIDIEPGVVEIPEDVPPATPPPVPPVTPTRVRKR